MSSVSDIITGGLRLIGIRDLTDDDRQDEAIAALNSILGAMRRSFHHAPVEENFTLTAGTESYTIGTGGDFDTDRPMEIISAFIRDTDGNDHYVDCYMAKKDYDEVWDKDSSGRPGKLYYAKENPLGVIYLNSAPASAEDLYITSIKPYTSYSAFTDTFLLPVEYEDPVKFMLAIRLAPEYNIIPDTLVTQQAAFYSSMLEAENLEPIPLAAIPVELRRAN